MPTPPYWSDAIRHLSRDPVMGGIIARYEGEILQSRGDAFQTLARSIAGQQISVKAADSVWRRTEAALGGITPRHFLSATEEALRGCGLSGGKICYLMALSGFFEDEAIAPGHWDTMEDAEIIAHLTRIKGIGVWTAEMFLIFHLMRPDVFPLADIGLQKAILLHYPEAAGSTAETPSRPELLKKLPTLAERWQPYRTVATWYLWRALDPVPVAY